MLSFFFVYYLYILNKIYIYDMELKFLCTSLLIIYDIMNITQYIPNMFIFENISSDKL